MLEAERESPQSAGSPVPDPAVMWSERSVGNCAVAVEEPQRMNLLGLLLANVMERALEDPKAQRKCVPLKGGVQVRAGRMEVRLKFNEGRVEVLRGSDDRPRASVSGDLTTLADVTLGGGVVRHYLRRRLKVGGNLYFLLKTLPLLRVP